MTKSIYPEEKGFVVERDSIGDMYIFVHFLTPVTAVFNGKKTDIEPGGCVMWEPNKPQIFYSPECELLHDWFRATPDLKYLIDKYSLECQKVYYPKPSSEITRILSEIEIEYISKEKMYNEISVAMTEKLFALLIRSADAESDSVVVDTEQRNDFIRARNEIHRNFSYDWTVKKMSELVNLSESRFYSLYKKVFGITPQHDLFMLRIQRAQNCLINTTYSVETIAALVGYKNQYHFIRQFKQYIGFPPGQYRKMHTQ